jgi:hypothetical protein
MNTFITNDDPKRCAKDLDSKRLGKQRVEGMQLLNTMNENNTKIGWKNHPIAVMWKDYQPQLRYYVNCMIEEWISRGFKNTMTLYEDTSSNMPWWFSWTQLQKSHQSSLLRKDFEHYQNVFDLKFLEDHRDHGYIWVNHLKEEHIELAKKKIYIAPELICFPVDRKNLKKNIAQ